MRNINSLTGAARIIGNGNLDIEIPCETGSDEVEVLSHALETMRTELKNLYRDMELQLADLKEARDALTASESKYRAIFENSGSALALIDENNIVTMINREFEKMTGYARAEVEGISNWMQYICRTEDLEKMMQYRKLRFSGSPDVPNSYEIHLAGKNGIMADVIVSVELLPGTRQTLAAMVNITKLKKAELALSQSELRFRAIFNNSYQSIILLTTAGVVLEANRTALDFIGGSETDAINKPFGETYWWSHSDEEQHKLHEAVNQAADGKLARYETTNLAADGTIHNIDFSIKPVFDDAGSVVLLIAEGRDITDRIRAESDRLRLEEQLRQSQKMESIGRLAGGIAHDFNNVLGGIMGTVSLLKHRFEKGVFDMEYTHNMIIIIEEAAIRAAGIVNQMLTLSRKHEMKLTATDLESCVKNVVNLCRNSFDKRIEISDNYPDRKVIIEADSARIEQVLLNICINASHAMTIMRSGDSPQGGRLTISVQAPRQIISTSRAPLPERSGNFAAITVSDTGVGMSSETIARIFDPFYSTKEKEKGTGLGLTMAYSIVHEHKGFIEVSSEEGKGTSFAIYLPASAIGSATEAPYEDTVLHHGTGNILIVDDEEVMRNVAANILGECGYTPISVEDGYTAIEIIKSGEMPVSLVLLDMAMPGISGKETFIELKKINPGLKVIMSSGFGQDQRVLESIETGVDRFIQKPYTLHNLSRAVHDVLDEKHDK